VVKNPRAPSQTPITSSPDGLNGKPHPRRAELLAVAVEAIRSEGPAVSMQQIASIGSVTKPILYRAFGSKEGLYQAVADWFVGEFLSEVITAMDGADQVSLGQFIENTLDRVLARIEADANLYHFLMRRARMALTSAAPSADDDFLRRFGDVVANFMGAQLVNTGRDPAPAALWAHAVVGLINNSADWWLDHPEVPRSDVVAWLGPVLSDGFAGAIGPTGAVGGMPADSPPEPG